MSAEGKNKREPSPTEMTELKRLYGYAATEDVMPGKAHIGYVRELSEYEREFFGRRFVSPYFFEQTLYKVQGNLLPQKFNRAIREMVEKTETLRCNYVTIEGRNLCVVFDRRNEDPFPHYYNLEHIATEELDDALKQYMEADRREPFDLAYSNLLRFAVFHTGSDEYAVLVTASRLIVESIDIAALCHAAMSGTQYEPSAASKVLPEQNILAASVKNHWQRVFTNFPAPPVIPYRQPSEGKAYRQKSFRLALPAALMSDLNREAKVNRVMLTSLLLTTWGLTIKQVNPNKEISLCLLMPDKTEPGAVRTFPLRFSFLPGNTCEQMVNATFHELLVSRPYAKFGWSGLTEVAPQQGSLFNHFLSFYDFFDSGAGYTKTKATPSGNIAMSNIWDSQGMSLGLYFRDNGETVSIVFIYDEEQFVYQGIPKLAKRYLLTMSQLLTDWHLPAVKFMERLTVRITLQEEAEREKKMENRAVLQDAVSKIPFLQGISAGTLQDFLPVSQLVTYFEGDRIADKYMEENLLFVAEGLLQRSMDAGDGWYNLLDLVGKNEWVNETTLLDNRTSHMAAEVLSEEATIVAIPLDKMRSVLRVEPEIKDKLLQHVLAEMEKYQKRWVHS